MVITLKNLQRGCLKVGLVLATTAAVSCAKNSDNSGSTSQPAVPALHVLRTHNFTAPYSCKGDYEKSVLYLSDFSHNGRAPELMFNGSMETKTDGSVICSGATYFEPGGGGDDLSLIADLGNVQIDAVTADLAIRANGPRETNQIHFQKSVSAVEGHTYSVITNYNGVRALFVFTVDKLDPNSRTTIRYVVKDYEIMSSKKRAEGFDWKSTNTP